MLRGKCKYILTLLFIVTVTFLIGCSNQNSSGYTVQIGNRYIETEKKLDYTFTSLPLDGVVTVLVKSNKSFDPVSLTLKVICEAESKVICEENFSSKDKSNMYATASFKSLYQGAYYIKVTENGTNIIYETLTKAK